jgi:4'-phosphopantetheinyl transferase
MSLIKIHNRFLNDVAWGNFSSGNFVAGNGVDIWGIDIDSNLKHLNNFLSVINAPELARANRYLHVRDRNRFIISRGALRIILGRYLNLEPSQVEFETGENKKPFLKNTPLFYNISHSGDRIILAVSPSEVGIDIEIINPDFDFKDILTDYFSREEADFIQQNRSYERFFLIWTRKEAFTKATGKGLNEYIKYIPCLDGVQSADGDTVLSATDMYVTSFGLPGGYVASMATTHSTTDIRFWHIGFSF